LQLPNPLAQFGTHKPCWQVRVATLVLAQEPAQLPQWLTLLWMSVSQPLPGLLSQSRKLPMHEVILQPKIDPPRSAHAMTALAASHALPQAPQLLAVRMSVSQPLLETPSQLA
jgi:hypothetical protein